MTETKTDRAELSAAAMRRRDREHGLISWLILVLSIGLAAAFVAIVLLSSRVSGAVHEARVAQARADKLAVQVHRLRDALDKANRVIVRLGGKPVAVESGSGSPSGGPQANPGGRTAAPNPSQRPSDRPSHRPSQKPSGRPSPSPSPSGVVCRLTDGQICLKPLTGMDPLR